MNITLIKDALNKPSPSGRGLSEGPLDQSVAQLASPNWRLNQRILKGGLVLLGGLFATALPAASFDCAKARATVEKLICADTDLSRQDQRLSEVYGKAAERLAEDKTRLKQLGDEQKAWLRQRGRCTDMACLKQVYRTRISELEGRSDRSGSQAGIDLGTPLNGWRNSFDQRVDHSRYFGGMAPAADTEDEENRSNVIRGRIDANGDEPFQLIVNGNPMPLLVENGKFFQPYTFSPGSNTVEIRSPDRRKHVRTQFYEVHQETAHPKMRIILSWDTHAELDLHVITPDGAHCSWNNPVLENGGAIDVDLSRGGYGPKMFVTPTPLAGTYLVYVNYWSDWNAGAEGNPHDGITVAKLTIVTDENTPDEKVRTLMLPLRHPGELVKADSFVYP
ncbi:hypothetical protein sS8_1599 [Methylocaldum marinum]|uniref:Lysozyme inhibitor LprI N-terminal domain-containing protein n=1 Tax=Methylocaldum marinum TaxID=1432792 RepID=A0A250KPQ1_9GAMM|nr:DUF2135 domain-containing protein [Methylocaldum marinum]BBA33557.1 hypothetical protein sS8_1599 [Methylocaldum marinum]